VAAHPGRVRIGISGWRYAAWRGKFYPKGLRQKDELAYAAGKFPTVEINGTFYSLQSPELFRGWAEATPDDFVFAVKGPRFITHMLRLTRPERPLANFFANGLLALAPKLGPILWQLPPHFRFDPDKLDSFFRLLPRDTAAAAALARGHDHRVKSRATFAVDRKRRLRHAIEIRHDSFRTPDFIALLRRHRIALVCADTVEWPLLMDLTADFVYLRLHGSEVLYTSGYDDPALKRWAARVAAWAKGAEPRDAVRVTAEPAAMAGAKPAGFKGRDVYVYLDNDAKVRAPVDAERLIGLVKAPLR
jgi:uncharacterized protein YecE (DUF72 family)